MFRARGVLLAAIVVALLGASDAWAATRIGASPALYPTFDSKVSDYVSRCNSGRKLRLTLHAAHGTRIAVGGSKPKAGKSKAVRRRRGGQGVAIKVITGKKRSVYHVRCLPRDFIHWTARRRGQPQAGFYIVTPAVPGSGSRYVVIFDNHGVPVWWRTGNQPVDAKLLPDGNLAWSHYAGATFALSPDQYEEYRLDGGHVRQIHAVGENTDFHDFQVMPNGDDLLLSYVPRDEPVDLSPYGGPANALVLDGVAQEISPAGKVVWSWNSKDHLATSESEPRMPTVVSMPVTLPDGRTAYDLAHINAIEPAGDSFLISLAFTDAVYKVSRATGAVEWKLGGTHTAASLDVPGEPAGSFVLGSQHDARMLSDGTLTLHNNRTNSGLRPRAERYRIDEAARTATRIEGVSDPQIDTSICCGSSRKLPGGDWVASWGFQPVVDELSPKGKIVFGLHLTGLYSYRAIPVLAKQLSIHELRAGMDSMYGR